MEMLPHTPRSLSGETLDDKAKFHHQANERLHARRLEDGRTMVEIAWLAGRALAGIKDGCKHGEFGPRIERLDIPRSTATVYLRIFAGHQIASASNFGSIAEALKALPAPEREPVNRERQSHRTAERQSRKVRERQQEEEERQTDKAMIEHYREEAAAANVRTIAEPTEREAERENENETLRRTLDETRQELARVRAERDDGLAKIAYLEATLKRSEG